MDVVSVSLLLLHQNLQSSNELIKAMLQLTCTWYFSVCPDCLVWSSCSCDHIAVHLYQCGAGLMPHSPVNPSEIKEQLFTILLTCHHSTNYSKKCWNFIKITGDIIRQCIFWSKHHKGQTYSINASIRCRRRWRDETLPRGRQMIWGRQKYNTH